MPYGRSSHSNIIHLGAQKLIQECVSDAWHGRGSRNPSTVVPAFARAEPSWLGPPVGLLIGIPCFRRPRRYIAAVNDLSHPSCLICGAVVPGALMSLHRDWHAHQDGQATCRFDRADVEPEVSQLVGFVSALKAIPTVASRPDFAAKLRDELMAAAFSLAIEPDEPAGPGDHSVAWRSVSRSL